MSSDSSTSVPTLRTLDDKITLDAALEEERDMLRRLMYWEKSFDFLVYLLNHSAEIEAVVSYHLNLSGKESCYLAPLDQWIHGSFNMCLPVYSKKLESACRKASPNQISFTIQSRRIVPTFQYPNC